MTSKVGWFDLNNINCGLLAMPLEQGTKPFEAAIRAPTRSGPAIAADPAQPHVAVVQDSGHEQASRDFAVVPASCLDTYARSRTISHLKPDEPGKIADAQMASSDRSA
jgi:hypothetical protein